ncbi:MAG: helix-turn-helix domain-containing protein [Ruminococcus sp.]|nr:helix-turn-helix domain-containing protein [Ruminococcus sp.]
MPNEIFALGLSGGAILVYTYLRYCENRETYQCYPSYKTIGKAVGMSKNTVKKYVDVLRDKGLIETENTSVVTAKGQKRNGNLLYTLRPVEEAVKLFYEEQNRRLNEEIGRAQTLKNIEKFGVQVEKSA